MPESIHVARWMTNLAGLGWDIHFFPVFYDPAVPTPAHPQIAGITCWDYSGLTEERPWRDVVVQSPLTVAERTAQELIGRQPDVARVLARLIRQLHPDIVHSLEFQHAGYTTLAARGYLGQEEMPIWITTNFGSDIFLFGQLPEHRLRIRALLAAADVHVCECARDLALGRELGFTGWEAPLIPMGGGWDLDAAAVHRSPGPTSRRRTIALKSYEGWAGRAGVALEALRRCGDALAGYQLILYLASHEFAKRAARLTDGTGLTVKHVGGQPGVVSYEQMLALHGRSRISIGLSISDAISISLLEAMIMGSFPIQSNTSCADEWIQDGVNGILLHPEDPQPLADAICQVLADDNLVDIASELNARVARESLAYTIVRDKIINLYEQAAALPKARQSDVNGSRSSGVFIPARTMGKQSISTSTAIPMTDRLSHMHSPLQRTLPIISGFITHLNQ
jgi:hypothetical protein